MKKILVFGLMVLGAVFVFNFVRTTSGQTQTANCKCVADILAEVEKIKVGMKRKDLDKIFSFDGGISRPNPQRFVFNRCNFVKIDVKFEFIEKSEQFLKGNPEDKITEVSKPYLEHPFDD